MQAATWRLVFARTGRAEPDWPTNCGTNGRNVGTDSLMEKLPSQDFQALFIGMQGKYSFRSAHVKTFLKKVFRALRVPV